MVREKWHTRLLCIACVYLLPSQGRVRVQCSVHTVRRYMLAIIAAHEFDID